MSKPAVRIVLTVLISLAVLAGIYSTVQSAAASAGVKVGQTHVSAGLLADLSHPRSSSESQEFMPFKDGPGQDCERDAVDPSDY